LQFYSFVITAFEMRNASLSRDQTGKAIVKCSVLDDIVTTAVLMVKAMMVVMMMLVF
jgi:hypothetical protein